MTDSRSSMRRFEIVMPCVLSICSTCFSRPAIVPSKVSMRTSQNGKVGAGHRGRQPEPSRSVQIRGEVPRDRPELRVVQGQALQILPDLQWRVSAVDPKEHAPHTDLSNTPDDALLDVGREAGADDRG